MPDSSYDTAANPAYFAIWQSTVEFHSMLKSRAEIYRGNDPVLDLKHFERASREVIPFLYNHRYLKPKDRLIDILAELMLVVGGILMTPFINELIDWTRIPRSVFSPSGNAVLVATIGVLLIIFKLLLKYRG